MDISGETLIAQSESCAKVELYIPSHSAYFDGHFEGYKLLPAAAQLFIAVKLSHKYLGVGALIRSAKRLKFLRPVLPDIPVRVCMERNAQNGIVVYTFKSPDGTGIFSSGTFVPM